jgi:hypothetical protein
LIRSDQSNQQKRRNNRNKTLNLKKAQTKFLANMKKLKKIEKYFLNRKHHRNEKNNKKFESLKNSQNKEKLFKNRYSKKKNNVKIKGRRKGKSLEINNKFRNRKSKPRRMSFLINKTSFVLSSLYNVTKNKKTKTSKIKDLIKSKFKLSNNFLFDKGFKIDHKATRKNSLLISQNSFPKSKINNFILNNFTSIKSIKNSYYNFKVISSGRFSISSTAKSIFTDETFLIKSYEIKRLIDENLISHFLVSLLKLF